ncbi:hypothetical protein L2E82_17013 [Cichorium intybus]|uniref:Uncharacterized protein n=1 Tax=Cichorium intybus TaxID=13427 RepID=A0ACB9F6R8_CICIN|nr:hypothetical protein L2E82_17013 [Cichorium intybus]
MCIFFFVPNDFVFWLSVYIGVLSQMINYSNASIYEVLRTLKVVPQQETEQSEYGFIAHLMKSEVHSSLDSSRLLVLGLWISPLNIGKCSTSSRFILLPKIAVLGLEED